MAGESRFFNPWQYRILSPLIVEGVFRVYMHTLDKVLNIDEFARKRHIADSLQLQQNNSQMWSIIGNDDDSEYYAYYERSRRLRDDMRNPVYVKYTMVFLFSRFVQNLLIIFLAYKLYSHFIRNKWMLLFSLGLVSIIMGNSVNDSDLSFNTYTDIIMYLLAGLVIVGRHNPLWIIPITAVAALNRETSLFIPALLFVSYSSLPEPLLSNISRWKEIKLPPARIWAITIGAFVGFALMFVAVRWYYGYQPQEQWRVPVGLPLLKMNLFSSIAIKSYFEMFGTFSLLPFIFIYKFKQIDSRLQWWFLLVFPVWMGIHFTSAIAYQSRLFLVPTLLILLPGVMQYIEQSIVKQFSKVKHTETV